MMDGSTTRRGAHPSTARVGAALALLTLGFAVLQGPLAEGAAQATSSATISPTADRGNGLVAFVSDRDGNREIYTMDSEGAHLSDITNDPSMDLDPAWSPDGTRIAFASDRTGDFDVWVMDADGSNPVDLTNDPSSDSEPTWSSDGSQVAFVTDRDGNREVYSMDADGKHPLDLTNDPSSDGDPAWSPDGSRIAFDSDRTGSPDIYVMNADGSDVVNLTADPSTDSHAAWSPDGSRIAFDSDRTGSPDIYVMNADGSGVSDVTRTPASETEPTFSPDHGTRLLYNSDAPGDRDILWSNLTPAGTTFGVPGDITQNDADDAQPDWQPLLGAPAVPSPIQHVVVIDMENHSFDNVLGRLCLEDERCDSVSSGFLANGHEIQLGDTPDLVPAVVHGYYSQQKAIDGGKMDGFSLIQGCTAGLQYACYSQYDPEQIPALAALARGFALSDRTFQTNAVSSWGAHLELAASTLDGFDTGETRPPPFGAPRGWGCDSPLIAEWHASVFDPFIHQPRCIPMPDGRGPHTASTVPWVSTIMDRLDGAGISWHLYAPKLHEEGYGWAICPTFADCLYTDQKQQWRRPQYFAPDATSGSLPGFSIIIPNSPQSQHNQYSMFEGDNWIATQVSAVMNGPQWNSTAIFISYDDCGCFYDHVPPPNDSLGLRVPMVIVSPYAVAGFTDSNVASFASILAFTEHVFGLAPLSSVDAGAYDFMGSFDFGQPPRPGIQLPFHRVPPNSRRQIRANPPDPDDPT